VVLLGDVFHTVLPPSVTLKTGGPAGPFARWTYQNETLYALPTVRKP
jgi:hypothetical protein